MRIDAARPALASTVAFVLAGNDRGHDAGVGDAERRDAADP